MMQKILEYYNKLNSIPSVSGNEDNLTWELLDWVDSHCDFAETDAMGNLICEYRGESNDAKKIMFTAHIDTAGIVVTHVDDNGFVRFSPVGGLEIADMINRKVRFDDGVDDEVYGVIAYEGKTAIGDLERSQLYIDLGADSGDAVRKMGIFVGTFADFAGDALLQGDKLVAPYLDNRIGCITLMLAMEKLHAMPRKNNLYFVFSVQGAMGFRGAGAPVSTLQPDEIVAIDVTDTNDTPGAKRTNAMALGKGPAVKVMDKSMVASRRVMNLLQVCAPVTTQMDVTNYGGTEAGTMQKIGKGALAGALSIPIRNRHGAYEMVSTKDVAGAVEILTAYANL